MERMELRPGRPHLLLDGAGMAEAEGIAFRAHPPRAEGIVLAPERDWEAYRVMPLAVLEDAGVLKLWYSAVACHPGSLHPLTCPRCGRQSPGSTVVCTACGWPLLDIDYMQQEMYGACYVESSDGIHWERPDLGLVELRGSRRNNRVAGPCGVPALNPRGPAAERFVSLVEHQRQLYVSVSPDGLRWTRRPQPCLPFCADTNNQVIYDPETQTYVALLRGFPGRRTTVCCVVDDLDRVPWPYEEHGHAADSTGCRYITDELPTVLDVDAGDPALPGLDLNHISAYRYGAGAWLGFPALFRKYPPAGLDRAGREGHRFYGRCWTRPDRTAYLGPGLFGGLDGGLNGLYGAGLVQRGDQVWQYGFGQRATHGIFDPGQQRGVGAIYRFVQPRDRFMAAAAGPRGGRLLTHPFELSGGRLVLNVDCGGLGEASIEVGDAGGQPLPGFAHADCDRVDLNPLAHVVTWRGRGDLSSLRGKLVRLDVRLQCARLYAMALT